MVFVILINNTMIGGLVPCPDAECKGCVPLVDVILDTESTLNCPVCGHPFGVKPRVEPDPMLVRINTPRGTRISSEMFGGAINPDAWNSMLCCQCGTGKTRYLHERTLERARRGEAPTSECFHGCTHKLNHRHCALLYSPWLDGEEGPMVWVVFRRDPKDHEGE